MAEGSGKRDLMGSKSDMISSKIDEVSRNCIWREHLRKEHRLQGPIGPFQINPKTMVPIVPKPTEVDPRDYMGAAAAEAAAADAPASAEQAELSEVLARASRAPREKSQYAQTAAQEVGWMADLARTEHRIRSNARWRRDKNTCDITRYAAKYTAMARANPFADKSNR